MIKLVAAQGCRLRISSSVCLNVCSSSFSSRFYSSIRSSPVRARVSLTKHLDKDSYLIVIHLGSHQKVCNCLYGSAVEVTIFQSPFSGHRHRSRFFKIIRKLLAISQLEHAKPYRFRLCPMGNWDMFLIKCGYNFICPFVIPAIHSLSQLYL